MEKAELLRPERCPYCGGALEEGMIYTCGGPGLLFIRKLPKARWLMSPRRLSKEEGSIVLDGIYRTRVNETKLRAYACRSCKAVTCFYGEEIEDDDERFYVTF